MKKLLLAAVGLMVLAAGPTVAADLRAKPAYIPPPAPPPPSFTGCYVNGGAGYGLWNIDHSSQSAGQQFTTETTSGGRGWLGRFGGGCDYQFGSGTGFWSNWVVGAFADYDFMDLHKNFDIPVFGVAGEEKEKNAWAVGGRIGYLVTPNVFTYWDGGYTQTEFDQINLNFVDSPFESFGSIGSHTYNGWFLGGGYEIGLAGFFGWQLPPGLFWRTEYRYSSFNNADLPVNIAGVQTRFSEHMTPNVQTITTSLVWKFNWWGH